MWRNRLSTHHPKLECWSLEVPEVGESVLDPFVVGGDRRATVEPRKGRRSNRLDTGERLSVHTFVHRYAKRREYRRGDIQEMRVLEGHTSLDVRSNRRDYPV